METYILNQEGKKLYCRVEGEGEPLLLVHGAVVDADFFEEVSAMLSKFYRVISYDRRGYSRSERCENCSLEDEVSDAIEVIRQLAKEPVIVVGCSMGGLIGMVMTAKHPEMVRQLFVHEPPLHKFRDIKNATEIEAFDKIDELVGQEKYKKALIEFLLLTNGRNDDRAKPYSFEKIDQQMANGKLCMEKEYMAILQTPEETYCIDLLKETGVKVICLCGDSGRETYTAKAAIELAKRLECPHYYVPGGHNAARDLPTEFASILLGLLNLK